MGGGRGRREVGGGDGSGGRGREGLSSGEYHGAGRRRGSGEYDDSKLNTVMLTI